jgi:TRAP-type C4-dicarboxylate transport system permease small subunit
VIDKGWGLGWVSRRGASLSMDILWTGITWIARIFARIGGAMIMVAALIVSAEVISRKLLALPFSGSDEIGAYLFAVGTSWSMAFVLVTRGHVRIDALYATFSPFVRALLDLVALIGLATLVIALADRAWELLSDNLAGWNRSNTPLRVPLVYPQLPWFLGFAFFLFALIIALVRAVVALVGGDYAKVAATIGVPSQDEEVQGEIKGLGIKPQHATEES